MHGCDAGGHVGNTCDLRNGPGADNATDGTRGGTMTRRSTGKRRVARSLWYVRKGKVELRLAPLPPPKPDEAAVRTLFSGISRGTERLVLNGEVGRSEWERMRCPNQDGAFPFPVKYGYCA